MDVAKLDRRYGPIAIVNLVKGGLGGVDTYPAVVMFWGEDTAEDIKVTLGFTWCLE